MTGARAADERRAILLLRLAGAAVLILFVVLTVIGPSTPVVANPPGFTSPVAGIELAGSSSDVLGILGGPEAPARPETVRRMRLSLLVDMAFLVAYPTFVVAMALLLRARGHLSPGLATLVLVLAPVMAVGDALENRQIWLLCDLFDPLAMEPVLARLRVFTLMKWHAIFGASAVLALGVARERGWWRWSAPLFGLGALLGFASVVHLPAIEWSMGAIGAAWILTWVAALRAAPVLAALLLLAG